MDEQDNRSGFKTAIRRLSEAHEAALTESILFTRPILTASKSELVSTLISLLSQLIDYRAGCAWIVDGASLYDSISFGDTERHQSEFDRHFRDGLAGWVSESRRLHVVPAPQGCFVLIPVVSKTNNYALVDLALNLNVDQLTKPAIELMENLAGLTALALEQHHLADWQKSIRRFMELLPERSNITDPTRLLETVISDIRGLLGVDSCSVMLVDLKTQTLRVAAAAGLPDEFRSTRVPIGSGLSGRVAQSGRPLFIEDSRQDSRFDFDWRDSYEGRSIISLPLVHRGQILGVLNATNRHSSRRLYQSDAALLELFASHVALAWQQAVLIEHLKLESGEWSAMFDVIGEGVLVLNTQEQIVRASKKVHSLFPVAGTQIIGRRLSELIPSASDDLHRIFNTVATLPSTKHELNIIVDRQSLRLNLRSVINAAGIVTGYVGRFSGVESALPLADRDLGQTADLFNAILKSVSKAKMAPASSLLSELEQIVRLAQTGLGGPRQLNLGLRPAIPVESSTQTVTPTVAESSRAAVPANRIRILVVDDENEMRDLLKDILELAGYEIVAVGTGPDAIVMLDKMAFNLVITDLGMPLLNGWEVARAVKVRQPNTPVIMVSGWGPEIEQQGQELGVDLVLPKPFQVDAVVESVERVLSQSAESRNRSITGDV